MWLAGGDRELGRAAGGFRWKEATGRRCDPATGRSCPIPRYWTLPRHTCAVAREGGALANATRSVRQAHPRTHRRSTGDLRARPQRRDAADPLLPSERRQGRGWRRDATTAPSAVLGRRRSCGAADSVMIR